MSSMSMSMSIEHQRPMLDMAHHRRHCATVQTASYLRLLLLLLLLRYIHPAFVVCVVCDQRSCTCP
jgi:hypothetical protein